VRAQYPLKRLVIEPTYSCNLHCWHCYVYRSARAVHRMAHVGDSLPLSFWRQVLRSAPEGISVHFTGGEVFTYPKARDLLACAATRFPFTLSTNGTFLDTRTCQYLAQLAPRHVTISILGTPSIHDTITGVPGAYHGAAGAVERLSRLLPAGRVDVNFVLLPENVSAVAEVARRVEDLGAARLVIQLFDPALSRCGIAAGLEVPAPQNLDWSGVDLPRLRQVLEIAQSRNRPGIEIALASTMTPAEIIDYISGGFDIRLWACTERFDTLRCSPTGVVYTCTGLVIGSLERQATLDLWQSKKYVAFRQDRSGAALERDCIGCCKMHRRRIAR
jgi:MoaA/NifB/PqqE/SkfB family radical SAM enzyme